MARTTTFLFGVLFAACSLIHHADSWGANDDNDTARWPSFRGVQASGVAEGFSLPAHWDVDKGENILWQTPVPGLGHSCPIVWGEKLFVTTAIRRAGSEDLKVGLYGDIQPVNDSSPQQWKIYCLNRASGDVIWERSALEKRPKIMRHPKSSHANSTPATDGKHLVTFFGSEGLFCFDLSGKLLWKKDLGLLDSGYYMAPKAQWGFGSSPVIHKDKVIIQCDVQKDSFVAALSLKDGSEIWRTPRKEVPTWSTPTLVEVDGKMQVVVNGYKHIGGYDLESGKVIWKLVGGGDIPVPTPVVSDNLIFITNAHGMLSPIYAVRKGVEGNIKLINQKFPETQMAWNIPRGGNYMPTPVVYQGNLYCASDRGILSVFEAETGKLHYKKRIGIGRTGFTGSPVAGDGKLYIASEEGEVFVVKTGPEFEMIATLQLGETCMSSPAIANGALYYRTRNKLIAIGDK